MSSAGKMLLLGLTIAAVLASADTGVASASHHPSCKSVRPKGAKIDQQNAHIVVWERNDPSGLREIDEWACARSVGRRVPIGGSYYGEESYGDFEIKQLNRISLVTGYTSVYDCEKNASTYKFNLRTGRIRELSSEKTVADPCY